jgi:hypothetical protein
MNTSKKMEGTVMFWTEGEECFIFIFSDGANLNKFKKFSLCFVKGLLRKTYVLDGEI